MCTSVVVKNKDGQELFGRTLDFPQRTPWALTFLPRGLEWWDVVTTKKRHLQHALLGGMRQAGGHWLIADAINDAGLMAAELYFPVAADYHQQPQTGKLNLSPESFIYWLLDRHSSVEEIKADLENVAIVGRKWFDNDKVFPFHWLIVDQTGTYVIEPLHKQLVLMADKANVLTNTPPLDKQLLRLNRRLGLSDNRFTSQTMDALRQFQGEIPKTNNAVDRFMKAALARWQGQLNDVASIYQFLTTVSIPANEHHKFNYTHYRGVMNRKRQQYWFNNVLTGQKISKCLPELAQKYSTVKTWPSA